MDEVKSEILQTSLRYFLQHGVRKMSNDKLVALLGISTKTLYKYFIDKEDLLQQALTLFHSQQHEQFDNMAREKPAPILLFYVWRRGFEIEFNVNKVFFHDLHYYYPELERKVEARLEKKLWVEFIQIINRGKKEGDLRKDIVPEVVLKGMSVLYTSIVRKGEFKKLGSSSTTILSNTIAAYIRGICTEKGAEILDGHIKRSKVLENENGSKRNSFTERDQ